MLVTKDHYKIKHTSPPFPSDALYMRGYNTSAKSVNSVIRNQTQILSVFFSDTRKRLLFGVLLTYVSRSTTSNSVLFHKKSSEQYQSNYQFRAVSDNIMYHVSSYLTCCRLFLRHCENKWGGLSESEAADEVIWRQGIGRAIKAILYCTERRCGYWCWETNSKHPTVITTSFI